MEIKFEKWHGNKNDFILVWFSEDALAFEALRKAAPSLCQRDGSGIGADGILVLHCQHSRQLMPHKLSIINSDGSLAQTCGNGIRCAALSILCRHLESEQKVDIPDAFPLPLESSVVTCRFVGRLEASRQGTLPLVAVEMGFPIINQANSDFNAAMAFLKSQATTLKLPELTQDAHLVSISNRHLCLFLDKVNRELVRKVGPALQTSDLWDGINVHLCADKAVSERDRKLSSEKLGRAIEVLYEVFVWERGAGETQACGSGASAIGAALFATGLVSRKNWIGIDMPGGRLYIKQESAEDLVTMAGPAERVFQGSFTL